jgi:ankyrin repeat protein
MLNINVGKSIVVLGTCSIIFLLSGCNPMGLGMQDASNPLGMSDAGNIEGVEVKEESLGDFSEETIINKLKESGPYNTFYWGLEHKNFQAIHLSLEEIDVKTNGFVVSLEFGDNEQIINVGPVGKYNHRSTLLHLALMYNNIEATKLLLSCEQIDVNQQNQFGEAPLHLAAKGSNAELIKCLLDHAAINVNQRENRGDSPLHSALKENNTEAITLLLEREKLDVNQPNNNGSTPLHLAVMYNNVEAVRLLTERADTDVNQQNNDGETPLHWPIRNKHTIPVIKLLLKRADTDVNRLDPFGITPLNLALQNKNPEVAKLLLGRADIDVNEKGTDDTSALCWATLHDYSEVINLLLLRENIDVNSQSNDGNTALYWALMHNSAEAVKMLVACEAIDLNQKNNRGETQLHIIAKLASYSLIPEVISVLEEKLSLARARRLGAVYEKFLLGREASYSHYDRQILKIMLNYGELNLNARNNAGKTFADLLRDTDMEAEAGRIEAIIAKYLNQVEVDDNKAS